MNQPNPPLKPANVVLTQAEGDAAIQLFDLAVKTKGLEVANNALALTAKIQRAFAEANKPAELEPEKELPRA